MKIKLLSILLLMFVMVISGKTEPLFSKPANVNSYENNLIRVSVQSIVKVKNRNTIALSLEIENKTKKDIYIGFLHGKGGFPKIMGNDGRVSQSHRTKIMGIPAILSRLKHNANEYEIISSGSKSQVNIVFDFTGGLDATTFSFTSTMLVHSGKLGKYSVSIPNIKL